MSAQSQRRVSQLLLAARHSPNFGLRLMAELSLDARAEAIRRLCQVSAPEVSVARLRPGVKKCAARPMAANNGLSAQLEAFARSVGRLG